MADSMKMSFDSNQELCFDKADFEKSNFSVDAFLDRRGTNFETLRDDLGQYLKELRSAMIELINQDYSDFVNLSSNLIGLDKSISKLKVPLGQFKEEILQVKGNLDEAIDELTVQLQARDQLRQSRNSLSNLKTLLSLLTKMETALNPPAKDDGSSGEVNLQRVSAQLSRSLVSLSNCRDLSTDLIKQHEMLELELFSRLDSKFLSTLKSSPGSERETTLTDCLLVYASLDKFSHAENLVKINVVVPLIVDTIREQTLRSGNVSAMLAAVMAALIDDTSALKLLIQLSRQEPLSKFDFVLHSYWPEVCDRMINNTPSLFAPGNPEEFYVKYTATMKFMDKLEISLGTLKKVEEFRLRTDYKNFMGKWNLPVYYQIRFQEIAGSLETVLEKGGGLNNLAPEDSQFQLEAVHTAWEAVQRCWQPGVFLHPLAHRFWKLSLQLISRLLVWVSQTLDGMRDEGEGLLQPSRLHFDLKLLSNKLPSVLDLARTGFHMTENIAVLLKGNIEESIAQCEEQKNRIVNKMVDMGNCRGEICKSVTDVPRTYRRTNREVPSRAGVYVPKFLQAARDIGHSPKFSSILDSKERKEIATKIITSVTDTYVKAVHDLLTSVQKTEDSLRRLKQIRDKSSSANMPSSGANTTVSDDDKIRLQILHDCREFKAQVEALGINPTEIPAIQELCELAEKSVNIPK